MASKGEDRPQERSNRMLDEALAEVAAVAQAKIRNRQYGEINLRLAFSNGDITTAKLTDEKTVVR